MMARESRRTRETFEIGGLLYKLSVVFPSWAGAYVLLYVLLSCGLAKPNVYF